MRITTLFIAVLIVSLAHTGSAADWLTLPSTYTHDPASGARVSQYAAVQAPAVPQAPNFRTSGYTHTRSTLNFGQSADNYHRVEQWGDPVRPYGEWRFPNRPFSAPYPNWGPPFAGFNLGVGQFGRGGFGPGGFGQGGFGQGGFGQGGFGQGGFGQGNFGQGGQPGTVDPGFGGNPGYRPGLPRGGYIGRPRLPGNPAAGASPLNPYPAGPGTPYPVAPYYDGYYPVYRE